MQKIVKIFDHIFKGIMVASISTMVILVFANVVLRYVFSSGIISSEELSRFLFVWLTFIGAVAAFKDNEHLGVDTLVKRLPIKIRKMVYIVSSLLMMLACGLILEGSWKLTMINLHSKAPATGLPLSFIYVTGILMSVAILLMLMINLYRLVFNKIKAEDFNLVKESEELLEFHQEQKGKEGKP
ncbi:MULTISPECIES: TRAP transporter small permease [unclassified Paenibacillus]|uniref:TRAP transporter small permease n=1 Tax=unclassified Paenibacillus TaxID=185978 RepID=UPI001AE3A64B|nr:MULTISPECIES: TRAP transporter small permease [unclassified Paenibacillus]MBP1155754.1 TRAP-type C4-dicarboxylate transport system permease small subunit [Paenibacillus sp. PvP091]MBP1168860.1 TRAP-type C4-dicarboxylate transport system permease small subunit [Paenibacillus sp. PvR098]MBP2439888.1 TRAP-type C4-dicarboxylate transport system permease small subunit [Paenibacillus sp. PvP052]